MRMQTKPALIAVLLIFAIEPALACRGTAGTSSLLDILPPAAQQQQVMAQVQIVELLPPTWVNSPDWKSTPRWNSTARVRVRVVTAIKGVREGQEFIVQGRDTSCDQAFPRDDPRFEAYIMTWRPYIAGQFGKAHLGEAIFQGEWTLDRRTGEERFVR